VTPDVTSLLREHGIRPSAQRVAVAEYVLSTDAHPAADQVFAAVRRRVPVLSRATVYNTLNLLVKKGLLRSQVLAPGKVVFDPNVSPHHHFIDEATGRIHDVPWERLKVEGVPALKGCRVREYHVVLRGRKTSR
jgi:Fe2+ or Zn2+ uptake regulation protein